jgi:Carboxypeptidase regulatory-like domain/TonB-dependent Receptor Plug Domain
MQRLLAILLFFFFSFGIALPQTETASLNGRVTDPSGAVVPGATVTLTNRETQVATEVKTNSNGVYTFPAVSPSRYELRVQAPGFKEQIIERLALHVQDRVSQDISLQVGSTSQSVTVTAETIPLNTQDASVGTVIERQQIDNTPLNGRTFQGLITLAPGVASVSGGSSNPGQFVVNGQRTDTSYFTVDGVSANAPAPGSGSLGVNGTGSGVTQSATGGYNNVVSVDAIQEFKISTSTFAPEYGRTPGGQISVVTRSGTNTFHGDAFDYLRNTVLDANDWFLNAAGKPRGVVHQNDFGGVFGGPLKKDKLFLFFSYEGLRLNAPQPSVKLVPTQNARTLAAASSDNGVTGWMGQFLNAYPLPDNNINPACTSLGTCLANYTSSFPSTSRLDSGSGRVDYTVNSKTNLFGRYSNAPSILSTANSVTVTSLNEGTQSYTAGLTHSFTDRIANDARFNYTHTTFVQAQLVPGFKGDITTIFPSGFGQPPASFVTSGSAVPGDMAVQIRPPTTDGFQLSPQQGNSWNYQNNATDTLSWIRGNHGLKFGGDYRQLNPEWNQASFNWNNSFAANATVQGSPANVCPTGTLPSNSPAGGGNTVPGFICGQATLSNLQHNYPQSFVFHQYSFFGQDTWRVSSKLTVTYGARWEINPPFGFTNGHAGFSVNQSTFNLNNFSTLQLNPFGSPPYHTTWNHISPRIGVAYQLSDNANWGNVIRAGYGIFYDTGGQTGTLLATPWNTRINNIGSGLPTAAFVLYPIAATSNCAATPWNGSATAKQASCVSYATPVSANLTPPVSNGGMDAIIDPNFTLPYVQQMNLTWEQKLGAPQSVTVSYVGALGRKLIGELGYPASLGNAAVFSLPPAGADAINVWGNFASSSYNALQAKFQRDFVSGLAVVASYTWSHSLDNASSNSGVSGQGSSFLVLPSASQAARGQPQSLLWASSDFDIRQNLALSLVYNLPTPFKSNALSKAILGGWSFDPIYHYQTAAPVDIFTGVNGAIGATSYQARPNLIPGVPIYVTGSTCDQQYQAIQGYLGCPGGAALNLAPVSASAAAAAGCVAPTGGTITGAGGIVLAGKTANAKGAFCTPASVLVGGVSTPVSGNFGRNGIRAFPLSELDFSVHRDIPIYERVHLRFQADLFNVLNHPQFGPYNASSSSLNNAGFGFTNTMANTYAGSGNSSGFGLNPIFATGAPRNAQFGLKVLF